LNHPEHLRQLTDKANAGGSFKDLKALLDYLILYKAGQNTETILERGIEVCEKHTSQIAENFYLIEEFFYAALALQQRDWADFFLNVVHAHFPKQVKTMRMLAMWHESNGEILRASNILIELIENDPSDHQSVKRLAAAYRDFDMEQQAI